MTEPPRDERNPGERTWPHPTMGQSLTAGGWPVGASPRDADDLAGRLTEPRERLDPRAKRVWFISEIVQTVVWTVIAGAIAFVLIRVFERDWLWPVVVAVAIFVLSAVWAFLGPSLRYRQWRYEIREDEVDLQHGILVKTRQLVPMARIQHVDTRRGPLQQRFGLASVVFFTAAGSMEIPALSREHAADVRNRIADLAKVHDDL